MRCIGNNGGVNTAIISALIVLAGLGGCSKSKSSAALVEEARQFQAKGDTKAAVIQLKNAVLKDAGDVQARRLLGALYIKSGDPVSAEKELRKAISLGASVASVQPGLAHAMLAQQQFQKVLDEIPVAGAAGAPALLSARGDALLGLGKSDQARESYESALKAEPAHTEAMIGLARYWLLQKDVARARALADEAVAKTGNSAAAWLLKANLLRVESKNDEALAAYDKVLAIEPTHRTAHIEKAGVDISQHKFDAAKLEIEAARKSDPANLAVSFTQALLDFSQGKHDAALESVQKVLRAAPDHMPTILLAGAIESARGAMQQAEHHLKKYLEQNPGNALARKMMGSALLKLGRTAEAVATLAPALRESPDDAQLLALAGEASLRAGDFAKATDYFQKASTLAPKTADLHTSLAISRLGQGDSERGISELELAAGLDTKSSRAALLLTLTEMRLKHHDKALAAVDALDKVRPNDPMVHNMRGGVYLGKGDIASARASFEKSLALQPTYFPAVANLAQLAVRERKPALAKQRLVAFLEKDQKSAEAMHALATLALAQGHTLEATSWLEKAQGDNPEALGPALTLIGYYLGTGDKQKSLALARKFQVAHADHPDLLDLLGQAQLANGDLPAALDTYGKLAAVTPKSAFAHFRLGSVHMVMKNASAGEESMKKALALQPDLSGAQVALVHAALRANKADVALSYARQMQKQHPKDELGYTVEGEVLLSQKKTGPALQAYEKALALNDTGPLMIRVHALLMESGKQKEADLRLAQWQRAHPGDVPTRMYVAEASMANKQYDMASKQLVAVLKLNPKNPAALNNLAWAYSQLKDPRALAIAEQAQQAAPDNPAVLDTLGWILVGQGNSARAIPFLEKAVAAAPSNSEFRYHLAGALAHAGDKAAARKQIDQLLSGNKNFAEIDEARALLRQL